MWNLDTEIGGSSIVCYFYIIWSSDQFRIQAKSTMGKKKNQTKLKAYSEAFQRKWCPNCADVTINWK